MARVLPPFHPDEWTLPAVLLEARAQRGRSLLADRRVAAALEAELLRTCPRFDVAPLAYCVTTDTVWLVIAARQDSAASRAMAVRWRQLTGLWYREHASQTLWRGRLASRPLADWGATWRAVRQVLHEPVRLGLSPRPTDYRWAGIPLAFSGADRSVRPAPR
jgi:REP element-mobilizing transposase RayT